MNKSFTIKSKMESIEKINELGLNKFPEQLFKNCDNNKVIEFINKYPAKYYAIRDKSNSSGIFKFKIEADKVLEEIKNYNTFTINVSSANYNENQLLVGEIQVLSNNEIYAILSTDSTASVRDAIRKPTFNIKTNIFDDRKLNKIPYFNYIYSYIVEHNLENLIVEFSLFDKKVGIKKENIVIYELRTHY